MKDLFVPYELAVKLKEKGFNEPCLATYTKNSDPYLWTGLKDGCKNSFCNHLPSEVTAPLWQQVIDWLREEKSVYLVPTIISGYKIYYKGEYFQEEFLSGETYYSGLQLGIEKALELI